ncbi:MAG: cation:proton antiporter [Deltaproteobacteria bacterium]|nr:cation:proton antiporter [Deltaproteobacteria bacterium]
MLEQFLLASFWFGLAVLATILANHLRISMALTEICIGLLAGTICEYYFNRPLLGSDEEWLRFLAGAGSVLLTFLAGAELEHQIMRLKIKEVLVVGLVSFLGPFLGCAAIAYYLLGWSPTASWLAGVALSTTSMAVVYAVMLETGFNKTEYGKGILGACFITDLGTVLALGLLFASFSWKTLLFFAVSALVIGGLPFVLTRLTRRYGFRTYAIRTKAVLVILFGLGALAFWSGNEAVLPAYIAGMVLAEAAAQDPVWIRRLRTLTIGFLTPFFFIRAGSLVSLPALLGAPLAFIVLLGGKVLTKIIGLYPAVIPFRQDRNERWYYTLMMSTGLTFGTISALYGLSHNLVSREQYSFLVAAVIASAVVPTLIAGFFFLPRHLLPEGPGATTPPAGPGKLVAEEEIDSLKDE